MIPHLIHVGCPKTGSVFLRGWFADHPEIAYREGGIGGFESLRDLVANATLTRRSRCMVTSSEQLTTPPVRTPGALIDYDLTEHNLIRGRQDICQTLGDLFPNAWILIVTRGFRAMSVSSYSQYVRTGGWEDPSTLMSSADPERLEVWNYDAIVEMYRSTFDPAKVIVLPYELLRDDPAAFVGTIAAKLGLTHRPPSPVVANRSLTGVELTWYPRLTRLMRRLPAGRFRSALFGRYVRAIFRNRFAPLIRLLQWVAPAEPLSATAFDGALDGFRGMADGLRYESCYDPYHAEYFIEDRPTVP